MKTESKIALSVYCLTPWLLYFVVRPVFSEGTGLIPLALIGGFWLAVSPITTAIGILMAYNEGKENKNAE